MISSGSRPFSAAQAAAVYLTNASVPLRNWLLGCRVRVRGSNNSVSRRGVGRLRGSSVTIRGDGNSIGLAPRARIRSCQVVIRGNGNKVSIGDSDLANVTITIAGDGNEVVLGDDCRIRDLDVVCEDDRDSITLGRGTSIHGSTKLAAIEGTSIRVGEGCLFAEGIQIRTGDSHSLTDLQGTRTNPSMDVSIGDHVWIGLNVTILKGALVGPHSVIGAGSLVCDRFPSPHCLIAGNPARPVREGIDWRPERLDSDAPVRLPQ